MTRYLLLMLPLFAAISGCQATTKQSACDGFAKLTPSLETSVYILKNDRAERRVGYGTMPRHAQAMFANDLGPSGLPAS